MLGLLYLVLCFFAGWAICNYAFPKLGSLTGKDYEKRRIDLSPYLILFPAWFVTGTLAVTWAVYLIAYIFRNTETPLFYANLIVLPLAAAAAALAVFLKLRNNSIKIKLFSSDRRVIRLELLLLAAITVLACVLMWTTFFIQGHKLYVGVSVFSDFSAHIGMIRSFSYGNNFPTAYSHYAGEDIRYHFMFQFLTGNLEFLGLRLDYAFNLPSILSFVSAFLLLYVLAVKITGKIGAGMLACLFFAFRSAKTLYTYLTKLPQGTNILQSLSENTGFLSDTPHEDWGLWNLNVYCNQRHLAFGLSVMFLVIIMMLPNLYEMFEAIKQLNFKRKENNKKKQSGFLRTFIDKMNLLFFTRAGWRVVDGKGAAATGVLLGSLGFFHGAALIGCMTVLFVVAILSARRLEFLIVAAITMLLSFLQTGFFIKGEAVAAKLYFGFIAENRTFFGVASYLERLLGILPFVLLAAFCLEKGVHKYLMLAFFAPLFFAFTVSLTVDVTVNHKYIMMSCILLGIFAASLVMKLFEQKKFLTGLVGVTLILFLTATGIYDFYTVLKKNSPDAAVVLDLEDPLTLWIKDNSNSKDIFLTHEYALNQVVLGGAMLYEGWPYFPWSAGYDTDKRYRQVIAMYEADTPEKLKELAVKNYIRFIIVDHSNRTSDYYTVNEANIQATYECVYTLGDGEYKTLVYDTKKPLN